MIKRIWENQAEFQADVLVAVANDQSRTESSVLIFDALGTTSRRSCPFESGVTSPARATGVPSRWSGQHRRHGRVAQLSTLDARGRDGHYDLITAEQRGRILLPLREGYTSFTKQWEETFAALAALLGLRIRAESDMSQFVVVLTALDQGFALRHRINGKIEFVTRPTGPNGESEDWTLFALGLEALVHQFFETDPDWQPERRAVADSEGLPGD